MKYRIDCDSHLSYFLREEDERSGATIELTEKEYDDYCRVEGAYLMWQSRFAEAEDKHLSQWRKK
jgi:hypothetical protein